MKKHPVSPSFIKQKAKQLKKEQNVSHAQALNEVVKPYGYSNYKNYLNCLESSRKQSESAKDVLLKKISSEKDMTEKVRLAARCIQEFRLPFWEQLEILQEFYSSGEGLQSVGQALVSKDDIQSFLLEYFRSDESKSELQSFPLLEHFVAGELNVKDLTYELNGNSLRVNGFYELKLEFEYEVPVEYRALPHVNRQPMFGDFALAIDKNKKITMENSSIGEESDEGFFMASFR